MENEIVTKNKFFIEKFINNDIFFIRMIYLPKQYCLYIKIKSNEMLNKNLRMEFYNLNVQFNQRNICNK